MRLCFICFIVILCLIIVVSLFLTVRPIFEGFDKPFTVEMVVARYMEKLDWIKTEPYNQFKYIVYNKGSNEDFVKTDRFIKEVKLENVGREGHTYLYHIIENYDNLPDITIFFVGSMELPRKDERGKKIIAELNKIDVPTSVFACTKPKVSVYEDEKDFTIDNYSSTNETNLAANGDKNVALSHIRPFGKWYNTYFKGVENKCISHFGLFAIAKETILAKPKTYYAELIKQLDKHHQPEEGHYFERSWYSVFSYVEPVITIY